MLCEHCNQNEATIHYTEVINGVKNEHHLCQECMHEMEGGMEGEFPLSKLIRGILSAHLAGIEQGAATSMELACDKCGMTYSEFLKVGKFGCSECYSVFGPLILDNIKKIQGNSVHTGKHYTNKSVDEEFDLLESASTSKSSNKQEQNVALMKKQLQKALEVEDYEEAARLRDAIRLVEKG